jgi:hypothetical protein
VVAFGFIKFKLGLEVGVLGVLGSVVRSYVKHIGICVGTQQMHSISIEFSEFVVVEVGHVGL